MPAFERKTNAIRDTVQFVTEALVRKCSVKKLFLEISQNSKENTCARVFFLIKLHFIKKETLAQVFSCEFCEVSKKSFLHRTPPVAASVVRRNTKHKIDENMRIERKEI